jgi:hypothetical protein
MSGVTHSPIRQALVYHDRRARRIAKAVVIITSSLLVALALALGEGGSQTPSSQPPAVAAEAAPIAPVGTRYDGGPEEGTRGARVSGPLSEPVSGTRYDGGPDEGSRGLGR